MSGFKKTGTWIIEFIESDFQYKQKTITSQICFIESPYY